MANVLQCCLLILCVLALMRSLWVHFFVLISIKFQLSLLCLSNQLVNVLQLSMSISFQWTISANFVFCELINIVSSQECKEDSLPGFWKFFFALMSFLLQCCHWIVELVCDSWIIDVFVCRLSRFACDTVASKNCIAPIPHRTCVFDSKHNLTYLLSGLTRQMLVLITFKWVWNIGVQNLPTPYSLDSLR